MRRWLGVFLGLALLVSLSDRLPAEERKKEDKTPQIQAAIRDLGSNDAEVRRAAAVALTRIGPDAKAAIPALLKRLKDPDPVVRQNSIDAIGEINAPSEEAVDALIPLLKDAEYLIRLKAAETLGKFGTLSAKAEKPLLELLKDPQPIVRGFAVQAVIKVLPPQKAVPAVVPLLKDPAWNVRRKTEIGLGAIGTPEAKRALELNGKKKSSE